MVLVATMHELLVVVQRVVVVVVAVTIEELAHDAPAQLGGHGDEPVQLGARGGALAQHGAHGGVLCDDALVQLDDDAPLQLGVRDDGVLLVRSIGVRVLGARDDVCVLHDERAVCEYDLYDRDE